MAASSRLMIAAAERHCPARIKIALPPGGLGKQLTLMQGWLDETCGASHWAMTPAGMRGGVKRRARERLCDAVVHRISGRDRRGRLPGPGRFAGVSHESR
jgi:hypothetical protein